jgi:hypothetical protein
MTTKPNAQQLNFAYSPSALRYRDLKSGRFVKPEVVRAAVDTVIDTETQRIRAISQQLVNGEINLAEWQIQMSTRLKQLHVAMGLAASGGVNGADPATLGYIGSQIKEQYKFLRKFAKQIKNGTQKLDGSLVARAALYAQSARGTFEDTVRRASKDIGNQLERRVLAPADHCETCLQQASLSWQPIGTLNRIGDSLCRSNCHCTFQFKAS